MSKINDNSSYFSSESASSLGTNIEAMNPWISSDYHLLGSLLKKKDDSKYIQDTMYVHQVKEGKDPLKDGYLDSDTAKIIEYHNSRIKKRDTFLFLGDVTEEEFLESDILNRVIQIVQNLNGYKILVKGNNDKLDDKYYYDMGFSEIYSKIESQHYLFTHKPVNVSDNKINVHGHIHGSKEYWDVDWRKHIDVYWKMNNGPQKLDTYLAWYKSGKYNGTTTLSHEYLTDDHIVDKGEVTA